MLPFRRTSNSIYNIRYVTLADNRVKPKTPHAEWVKRLGANKDSVFKAHYIPDKPWAASNFDGFLADLTKETNVGKYSTLAISN